METRGAGMPLVLTHHLRIAFMSYKISQSLGNSITSLSGLLKDRGHVINLFETDIEALQARDGLNWSTIREVCFLCVKLYLYSFTLKYQDETENKSELWASTSSSSPDILSRAYTTAVNVIQITTSKPAEAQYWTHHVYHCLIYAILFLLKLRSTSFFQTNLIDSASAQNAISQGWSFLRGKSLMADDHLSRLSAIIEYLSKSGEKHSDPLSVSVQSRMTANLVYDGVWSARQRFSQGVRDMRPADYTSTAALEDLAASWSYDPLGDPDASLEWNSILDGF